MLYAWKNIGNVWNLAKMFLANEIAGFLNKLHLWNKKMKKPDFLHVERNSLKLKADRKILGCKKINRINWRFDINSGKLKITLITGPPSYRGSSKIMVVCLFFRLSVHPSVSSAFSSGMAY